MGRFRGRNRVKTKFSDRNLTTKCIDPETRLTGQIRMCKHFKSHCEGK